MPNIYVTINQNAHDQNLIYFDFFFCLLGFDISCFHSIIIYKSSPDIATTPVLYFVMSENGKFNRERNVAQFIYNKVKSLYQWHFENLTPKWFETAFDK